MSFAYAYEYTYQDREYIIRTMNTQHTGLIREPYTYWSSCSRLQDCTQMH